MSDCCIPKKILFGWLAKTRPAGGRRKQWRDHIPKDLKLVGVSETGIMKQLVQEMHGMQCVVLAWMMLQNENRISAGKQTLIKSKIESYARCANDLSKASQVSRGTSV